MDWLGTQMDVTWNFEQKKIGKRCCESTFIFYIFTCDFTQVIGLDVYLLEINIVTKSITLRGHTA
jgi:hypothetical protein